MNIGEIQTYCYMVQRGKPAAMLPIQERYLEQAVRLVKNEPGLNYYIKPLYEGWVTLWIYKRQHILDVIKTVPDKPETVFDHWVLGKLFGYDEIAIQEFLTATVS